MHEQCHDVPPHTGAGWQRVDADNRRLAPETRQEYPAQSQWLPIMNLNDVLTTSFLVALLTAGIRLAMPILLAVLGEIITEKSGVLNLGLEGIMLMGALAGFMIAWWLEQTGMAPATAAWLGLLAGALAGVLMGFLL